MAVAVLPSAAGCWNGIALKTGGSVWEMRSVRSGHTESSELELVLKISAILSETTSFLGFFLWDCFGTINKMIVGQKYVP